MEITKRTFGYLILATFLLLLYVHEQTCIFQVSYAIQKKEREVAELNETYKLSKFRVARLRSPHVLNQRLKQLSLDLTTPTEQEIIRVLKPKIEQAKTSQITWPAPMNLLSHFVKEAQAKTNPRE